MIEEIEWNEGNTPKTSGYYMAYWLYGNKSYRVSELWFDGRLWWTGRAYVDDIEFLPSFRSIRPTDTMRSDVSTRIRAWANKPTYRKRIIK